MGRSRSAPSQAAPAASSLPEAMVTSWSFPILFGVIRVACIPERDPVPDHPGSPQQARTLDRVLAEAVADAVHRCLDPVQLGAHRGVSLVATIAGFRGPK